MAITVAVRRRKWGLWLAPTLRKLGFHVEVVRAATPNEAVEKVDLLVRRVFEQQRKLV